MNSPVHLCVRLAPRVACAGAPGPRNVGTRSSGSTSHTVDTFACSRSPPSFDHRHPTSLCVGRVFQPRCSVFQSVTYGQRCSFQKIPKTYRNATHHLCTTFAPPTKRSTEPPKPPLPPFCDYTALTPTRTLRRDGLKMQKGGLGGVRVPVSRLKVVGRNNKPQKTRGETVCDGASLS